MSEETVPALDHVDEYLKLAQEYDVSDVHLAPTSKPKWRRFGLLQPVWENAEILSPEQTEKLARNYLPAPELRRLEEKGDVDFAYDPGFGRFRASVVKTRLGWEMVFRVVETVEIVRYQFLTADYGMSFEVCQNIMESGIQNGITVICPVTGADACLQGITCSC